DPHRDRLTRDHLCPPGQEAAIATRFGDRRAGLAPGHALIAQLLDREDGTLRAILRVAAAHTRLDLAEEGRELAHPAAQVRVGVAKEDVHGRVDVGVRIDDAESLPQGDARLPHPDRMGWSVEATIY